MKWEIANTDRMPRLRSTRDVGAVKLEAQHSPCRGCPIGKAHCYGEAPPEHIDDQTKPIVRSHNPKAATHCCDCGTKLYSPYPKTKRCKPCAKKANYARSRRWYAEKHPNARTQKEHIARINGKE